MSGIVFGTAGHVDHGKTTLVAALTGIDTDRLPEEKARGISIELGFAWLDLPARRVAFVDVPGHERFVRQMIAGAAGIDVVLLVVAADEGVMPQTREHLAICAMLGVSIGAVVLTKADLVEADWLAMVADDVRALVRGTFLEGRPIVPFARGDASTRASVVALVDMLAVEASARGRDERDDRPFVLPFDRAFAVAGFGTIVTGTCMAGHVAVGDEITRWPDGASVRVRALEVHGERVAAIGAGHRVAVNIVGPSNDARVGVLSQAPGPRPASMIDATFVPIAGLPEPIDDGEKGLVHLGTERVEATLALLGSATTLGQPAQLRLSRPLVFLPGAPYVFRGFRTWPGRPDLGLTLGGGRALAPAERRRRLSESAAALVISLAGDDAERALHDWIADRGERGADVAGLDNTLPWSRAILERALTSALAVGSVVAVTPSLHVASASLVHLERAIVAALDRLHRDQPERAGMPEHELWTRVRPDAPAELIACVARRLITAGAIVRIETGSGQATPQLLARAGYQPPAAADHGALDHVAAMFVAAELTPPNPRELVGPDGRPAGALVDVLVKSGRLVRVSPELVFAAEVLARLEARVRTWFETHDWLEAQDLKTIANASRKYAIPLAEWLDRARVTVRVGDRRRLRG